MSRLDYEPAVIGLARKLGVSGEHAPVEAILGSCRGRIDRWVAEAGDVEDVEQLEALVTGRLQMMIEEVWTEADFDRLKAEYAVGKREGVFASLKMRFEDDGTYGMLVKRRHAAADDPDLYVAVIDCRGRKAARRFFTRWHEVIHRMTTDADPDTPMFRSAKDPIEQLMDEIAGRVGFYEPILAPALRAAMSGRDRLCFEVADDVKSRAFPTASLQATLRACTEMQPTPILLVEAAIAHKAAVLRKFNNPTPSMFDEDEPPGQLRAVTVIRNTASTREGFDIPTNMRVPASCVIATCFDAEAREAVTGRENLSSWEDSKGKRLPACDVWIEAKKVQDRVIALVQPVAWTRGRHLKPASSPLLDSDEPRHG